MPTLFDDLDALTGRKCSGSEFRIIVRTQHPHRRLSRETMYVSGIPYAMTSFVERAFVFGCREDAQSIIDKHFSDDDAEIIERSLLTP